MSASSPPATPLWFLEGLDAESRRFWRVPLTSWPFRIGRRPGLELVLPSPQISLEHVELSLADGRLRARDLGSTNGTLVNGLRIDGPTELREGDILLLANFELRLGQVSGSEADALLHISTLDIESPPRNLIARALRLRELLERGAVSVVFQPIVRLPRAEIVGYEALARGELDGLPSSPRDLLEMAEEAGLDGELAALCFRRCLELGAALPAPLALFLNTHPGELNRPQFLVDLGAIRRARPDLRLVIEISERFLASVAWMSELSSALRALAIEVAYDDFGAGQARINELAEVPPDFLKFDMALLRDLHRASDAKRRLVRTLVASAHELGMSTVAEGIETGDEAAACVELGFTHAQGFYFGRPAPPSWSGAAS